MANQYIGWGMPLKPTILGGGGGGAFTLNDSFIGLGTREIIGRTITSSDSTPYTWDQLYPSPAWRNGPFFTTGDPGIVGGKLIRRNATTAMYPGLLVPAVPNHWEVDFFFDANTNAVGGRGVGVHLWSDTNGTNATSEIPLHFSLGDNGAKISTASATMRDTGLVFFGADKNPATTPADVTFTTSLAWGVTYTVKLDAVGNTLTFTWPPQANTPSLTLTDPRLTGARRAGAGPERFIVLEDESDAANEPYNGFTGIRIRFD